MSVFADSSAVVKLYADEPGHEAIRALAVLVVSELARVEVAAALWRKHRIGELSLESTTVLVQAFEADYADVAGAQSLLIPLAVTSRLIEKAAALAATQALRAYDAVQLASAIAARDADPDCRTFAAFDRDLRRAAAQNGFGLLPA